MTVRQCMRDGQTDDRGWVDMRDDRGWVDMRDDRGWVDMRDGQTMSNGVKYLTGSDWVAGW